MPQRLILRTDPAAAYPEVAEFHARLAEVESTLTVGLSRNPADPALWTAALTSARGLSMGLDVAFDRYARLAEIDPHHLPGQLSMLQQLCPKWGGTWDLVHEFSHQAMTSAPLGAPNAVLVAEGHLEYFLEFGRSHMRLPHVRDDILEAAHRSVLHPDFRRDLGWVQTMNTFAMAFSLIGERKAAATMFDALGPHLTVGPWEYWHGDPATDFHRARAVAYRWSGIAAADFLLMLVGGIGRNASLRLLGMVWRGDS